MKTRILFVDDEELALRGLNRLLYSMRDEWEMAENRTVVGDREFLEVLGPQALV